MGTHETDVICVLLQKCALEIGAVKSIPEMLEKEHRKRKKKRKLNL